MADYFAEKLQEANQRIPTMEHMLGKGLLQPFNNTNSGARKIMHGVHRDHVFPLLNGEKAIIETGYEIRFGDKSSSVTTTDSDYDIIAKISKFSFSPNHHYWLIVRDRHSKRLDMIERISYEYITEEYGYLYNNSYIDSLSVGNSIPKDTIVQKSLAFDENNNRKDGVNFNVCYMSLDQNMEDSIIISQAAANKLVSPLIKPVQIMINENHIPLNLYGTDNMYKCIPDIGEEIQNNVLIALRKEKKEEVVFTESVDRLRKPMMSDEKKLLTGRVIDINIYCNNPENLDKYHNGQFKMYYNELQRMSTEIVAAVTPYVSQGYQISYDLEQLYANSKRVLNHDQYIEKKTFSNIILEVVVLEEKGLSEGDKVSNRYGGKGVVSRIIPDDQMPSFGYHGEKVDIIFNAFTMYNRQNPGQIFELSINNIGHEIINYICQNRLPVNQAFDMIIKFIDHVVPEQAKEFRSLLQSMNNYEAQFFLESIIRDGDIHISTLPITDSFDIDRLRALYEAFPFVEHRELKVPIRDSNGNIRYISARRKVIVGKEYVFRLKQFAEDKFSATSLSATNICGYNSKSKANKNFLELHSNTPIRFGNMEMNNFNHLGPEPVVENLMIHSSSPAARKSVRQMYTCNPFEVDIKLDKDATNRGPEIINTRLKTIGRVLKFRKIKKMRHKLTISPISFEKDPIIQPINFIHDDIGDINEFYKELDRINEAKKNNSETINPFKIAGTDQKRSRERMKVNRIMVNRKGKSLRQIAEELDRQEREQEDL